MKKTLAFFILTISAATLFAQEIALPAPAAKSGVDLFSAIGNRKVSRSYEKKEIPLAEVSTLLWSGLGMRQADAVSSATKANRNVSFSGDNAYINMYYLTDKGSWKYLPEKSALQTINNRDSRSAVSSATIPNASAMILYTIDTTLIPSFLKSLPGLFVQMGHATAGFAAQNVGLTASALKLASIVQYTLNANGAAEALKLGKGEVPLFVQQVGYAE
jgi:nitroreductase